MTVNVLFAAKSECLSDYETHLKSGLADAGIDAALSDDFPPGSVDYIVYSPDSDLQDFRPYTRARAVLNLWAGVEKTVGNPTLKIPFARMVDPGMTLSMTEYVVGHVLRYHLGMDAHIVNPGHVWNPVPPPLASERRVCVLGLGALGRSVAKALVGLGFDVSGWSRTARTLEGVTTHHGAEGLEAALTRGQIFVTLLPDTPETTNLIDAQALSLMPGGSFLINPGRGPLIDDDALLAALDSGRIAGATLDVFRTEPLPEKHPYWAHPRVTVTPHVAAATRPETAARVVVENIRRGETGEPFLHLVDPDRGY